MKSAFSRRAFLRGAGGLALSLPYLDRFALRARAQSKGQSPLRFVVFMHGQGFTMDAWLPKGTGSGFELSEILEPLADHKQRLLVLSNVDNLVRREMLKGNGHNPAARSLMTCWPFAGSVNANGTIKSAGGQVENGPSFGPSLEHVISGRISEGARFPRVDLKVNGKGMGENQIFWAEDQLPIQSEGDPVAAYARLTGAVDAGGQARPDFSARLRENRGSVLDAVLDSFSQLRRELSGDDAHRLDAHAEQVRALEQRLGSVAQANSCSPHEQKLSGDYDFMSKACDDQSCKAMIDNLVLALSCDLTRVGTIQFADYGSPTFPWLGLKVPGKWANWHEMIHLGQNDPGSRATMITVQRWYASQFAYLLDRMAAVEEADGSSLLDNSLVMWITDFGDASVHNTRRLPITLAGGLGGRIGTGRHIDLGNRTTGDLFTTILQLFGGDDTGFGMRVGAGGKQLVMGPVDLG